MEPETDKVQQYGTFFNGINLFWFVVLVLVIWQIKGCVFNQHRASSETNASQPR